VSVKLKTIDASCEPISIVIDPNGYNLSGLIKSDPEQSSKSTILSIITSPDRTAQKNYREKGSSEIFVFIRYRSGSLAQAQEFLASVDSIDFLAMR